MHKSAANIRNLICIILVIGLVGLSNAMGSSDTKIVVNVLFVCLASVVLLTKAAVQDKGAIDSNSW